MTTYPRVEYEMTESDHRALLESCRPVIAIAVGGIPPRGPQENANAAWNALGKRMGFDYMTVRPIPGKGTRFFTAVPSETPEARAEREARQNEERRHAEIVKLREEIAERERRLDELGRDTATTAALAAGAGGGGGEEVDGNE